MQKTTTIRTVSEHGETLRVQIVDGRKALVDPCDTATVVHVQPGRRARLVCYNFGEALTSCGRNPLTDVVEIDGSLGFVSVEQPHLGVFLCELAEGQVVKVLPIAEPAVAYAALPRPTPVLYAAAAASLC